MTAKPSDLFLERTLPSNVDAEKSVLGAILLDNRLCNQAMELLRREDFYLESHRKLFDRMIAISEQGRPIDTLTLSEELRKAGDFDAVGGMSYVASLMDSIPRLENIEQYASIVKEKSMLRRLIAAANQIIATAFEQQEPAPQIVDSAERLIFNIAEDRARDGFVDVGSVAHKRLEEIEAMGGRTEMITGVPTGFAELDKKTAGLQKSDLIILAARPSMGKCLAFDSEIVLANGEIATIEDVYRRRNARLFTLGADLRLGFTRPSAYVDDGIKPVFRVTTRLGRSVETTASHPFLTLGGWQRLAALAPGDRIAVPRRIDVFGDESIPEHEAKLIGYFIGDGCLRKSSPEFTNTDPRLQKDFADAVASFPCVVARTKSSAAPRSATSVVVAERSLVEVERREFADRLNRVLHERGRTQAWLAASIAVAPSSVSLWTSGACVPSASTFARLRASLEVSEGELAPKGLSSISKNGKNAVAVWLEELGLRGHGAHTKVLPPVVFRLRRELVALVLNRLFATDGWASRLRSGQGQIGYATVSERLARQVQHLLLRFGVVGSLRKRRVKYRDTHRVSWQLDVTDARSILTFASEIGIFGKEAQVDSVLAATRAKRYQTNKDLIPVEIWARIAKSKGSEPWAALARRAGIAGHTNIHVGRRAASRSRLRVLADALDDASLRSLATSDVYWDEIVSIEQAGMKQVYDLTIPGTHNFVANDICVHNTSFALNVAQYAAKAGYTVGVFSLEMSSQQLVSRLLCSEAHVDAHRFRTGYLNRDEWQRLAAGLQRMSQTRVFIDDTPGITTLEMRAKSRRLKQEHGLDLLVVDYLQLIQGRSTRGGDSRTNEVSQISRDLKMLAKELDVPLVALSQLSRAPETRTDHRPQLADLRESGSIEQDADVVAFIYREEVYNQTDENANMAELIIGKQRNGPIGTVKLAFLKEFTRFENLYTDGY